MNLDPMFDAVRLALRLCELVQTTMLSQIDKTSPKETSPVTLADYGAQVILSRVLQQHFPDDAILAEESSHDFLKLVAPEQRAKIVALLTTVLELSLTEADVISALDYGQGRQARRTWTLDPIDGTKGYIGKRHYSVGVGILEDGQPAGCIMGCPAFGQDMVGVQGAGALFYAYDGAAYRIPLAGNEPERIHTSTHTAPDNVVLVQSYEEKHGNKERKAAVYALSGYGQSPLYELDSMEKYALVAAGVADVCLHIPREVSIFNIWDHVPGTALVQSAGGKVTDLDGSPIDFSQGADIPCKGIIITNGALHETILAAVQQVMAQPG
jgi:3'(2'), 5'-bisphosphate nucleotidase